MCWKNRAQKTQPPTVEMNTFYPLNLAQKIINVQNKGGRCVTTDILKRNHRITAPNKNSSFSFSFPFQLWKFT